LTRVRFHCCSAAAALPVLDAGAELSTGTALPN
jgi:hypothetical protein